MSTNRFSAKDIKREKHTIDASDKVLGRLATEVAKILMGKNKPAFVPYLDMGDFVTITNASKIKVSGKKVKDKKYFRNSGYPGGLKSENFEDLLKRKPEFILEHSIKGMLPKNRLGAQIIKKLKVYSGPAKGEAKEAS